MHERFGAKRPDRMSSARLFRNFRTPTRIIRLAVMTEARSPLTLRNVESLLRDHGID